jgi:hypothetical protein
MWMEAPIPGAPALQPGGNLTLVLGVLPGLVRDATSIVTFVTVR